MATLRKKPKAEVEELPDDYSDVIDPDTLNPHLARIRAALNISDDVDAQVNVYRLNADGQGHDARVWASNDPDSFNLKTIALMHGSGGYRVKVYMPDGSGMSAIRLNSVQYIELTPAEESQVRAAKAAIDNPAAPVTQGGDMMGAIQAMMAGFQSTVAQILEANKQTAPAVDPFAMIEKLGNVMKAIAPTPVAQSSMGGLRESLEMLKLVKDVTGAGEGGDGMGASERLLLEAGKSFLPALAEGLKPKEQPLAPVLSTPAPPVAAALPAPQLSDAEQDKLMKLQLGLVLATRNAARGVKAEDYAVTLYDQLDEDDIQIIALEKDWFERICTIVPDCQTYRPWFEALRTTLLEFAIEDEIIARGADGALTLVTESGTTAETPDGTDGASNAATPGDPAIKP